MKEWLKNMFSSDQSVSSKRVFGAILVLWACILITVYNHDLIETMLYTGAALLGLETISNVFKKNNSNGQT